MNAGLQQLLLAEEKAKQLFKLVENRGLIIAGKTEKQLCDEIVQLAANEFGTATHWGKKIVRTGINTLEPYSADPTDLLIQDGDILFFDFHPVFEGWEADLGRTWVLGNDPLKNKIKKDVEAAWQEGNAWYWNQPTLTGAQFFNYASDLAKRYGYEFGNAIAGIYWESFRTNNLMIPMICAWMHIRTTILIYFNQIKMVIKGIGSWSYIL